MRDSVVAGLSGEATDQAHGDRYAGYWLTGQLVAGARRSGWTGTIAPGFLQRLVAGTAQAEVAETRDDDLVRQHGTTIAPFGSEMFTSFFDDANHSGDALHVLLGEAGPDAVEQLDLLNASFGGGVLTDTRGGPISVAAYLSRRFVTYNANSSATNNELQLATSDDLARLLRQSSADGSQLAAALRGKVMAEVGRVSGHAQQGFSSANQYANNTAIIENETVDWLLQMPENVTQALNTPGFGMGSDVYSSAVGGGYQPVLSVGELSLLTGAFAVATDFSVGGKNPAANYQRLIAESVAAAHTDAATGIGVDGNIQRMAFFDTSASWALIGLARRQDAVNASMWRNLAEAGNFVVALRKGPKAVKDHVKALIKNQSTLTNDEKLVISVVRSNVELKQSLVNEDRTAALAAVLASIRAAAPSGADSLKVVMKSGSNRLVPLPTARAVEIARLTEIDGALSAVQGRPDTTPLNLVKPEPALAHRAQFVFDAITGGSIDVSRVQKVLPHETSTAERLMQEGHEVQFLPAAQVAKSADARIDGDLWEFKAPEGSSSTTISDLLRHGRKQATHICIDLRRCPLSLRDALAQVQYAMGRHAGIELVTIIAHNGQVLERKR